MAEPVSARRRVPLALLLLYALAWSGGSVAYIPFLTILLPVRVEALAGTAGSVSWLAFLAFGGAIAASSGAILFGYLSDVTRLRKVWIALGLVLSCGLLIAISRAQTFPVLLAILLLWQLALNLMLAPLAAWAGDWVPDAQKGLLGGLLAFAPAFGAFSGAVVTWPGLASADLRLAAVAGMVCICVLPLLVVVRMPESARSERHGPAHDGQYLHLFANPLVVRMWLARLTIQVAEGALFAYLYLWFRGIDPGMTDSMAARLFTAVLVCSAPLALAVGHWSDRHGRPLLPLIACALVSAFGLVGMALARDLKPAIGAYALFGLASSVFLALHSAQTLRVLPREDRRGRDLGLFNLTNTVPSLVMPWLVLSLVPRFGFGAMFLLLAGLALIAALVLARMPHQI
ncbi:MAG: MFS transporter [Novosphingobium sp.]|nr:MFS transporter [Novosphingobium sp.]